MSTRSRVRPREALRAPVETLSDPAALARYAAELRPVVATIRSFAEDATAGEASSDSRERTEPGAESLKALRVVETRLDVAEHGDPAGCGGAGPVPCGSPPHFPGSGSKLDPEQRQLPRREPLRRLRRPGLPVQQRQLPRCRRVGAPTTARSTSTAGAPGVGAAGAGPGAAGAAGAAGPPLDGTTRRKPRPFGGGLDVARCTRIAIGISSPGSWQSAPPSVARRVARQCPIRASSPPAPSRASLRVFPGIQHML